MNLTIRNMTGIAIMTALCCILGPFTVPIGPVPVSLSTLAIFLCVYVLGTRDAVFAVGLYILLGLFGLPVFSGFAGGFAKVFGPTGGYIVGYLFLAVISGWFIDRFPAKRIYLHLVGMLLGEAVLYVFGTAWFMLLMQMPLKEALLLCVVPFIPFDLVKMGLATALGIGVRTALTKSGLVDYAGNER
ncbi:MAG: biotin transporter BioY [Lachnospiraceae bacterium]|nr:biotin transporter BioY [Lachnospiraceae bacterium]